MKMEKLRLSMIILLGLMIITPIVVQAENVNSGIVNPNEVTYGELSIKWWQWLLAIPAEKSPILDSTGKYCAVDQSGDIWFLVGTFGGDATRTCTIPTGKSIFIPIINDIYIGTDPTDTAKLAREITKKFIDNTSVLEATIDGKPLKSPQVYRASSPAFDVTLPVHNLAGIRPGVYGPSVTDGYWLLIEPLNVGSHYIFIHGVADGLDESATYHLTIQ